MDKSCLGFFVTQKMFWQKFQSYYPVQLGVLSFVNDPHPPFTELFEDFVM